MRESKYKAWCHIPCWKRIPGKGWSDKWIIADVSSLNIKTGKARVLFVDGNGNNNYHTINIESSELMQFTHKVDSTGKDIFEGDYLKLYNYLYEVIFDTDTAAFLRKTVARRGADNRWYSGGPSAPDHVGRCYPFHVDPAMNGVVMGNKFNGLLEIVEG